MPPKKSAVQKISRRPAAKRTEVRVLVGTRKGAFVFRSDPARRSWKIDGPFFAGQNIYHFVGDTRPNPKGDGPVLLAAVSNGWFGSDVHRSYDGGKSWKSSNGGLRYAEDSGLTMKIVWHIRPGRAAEPDAIYAGVDPAGLFKSEDGGETWSEVLGLNRHATRSRWNPGGGGLILHTIVLDPANDRRMYAAISAAGLFRTDDGGATWIPRNKNVRADFQPDKFPEFGQCVHKVVMAPGKPNRLYQQNHCGIYRSENAGDDWKDISSGASSRFGFPIAIHPRDPDKVWVIPLVGAEMRAVPGGSMAVYASADAGRHWTRQGTGLPPRNAWLTVLREAFAADVCDPAGLYFGTETGQLFYSSNEGKRWHLLADFLPPILSVETVQA